MRTTAQDAWSPVAKRIFSARTSSCGILAWFRLHPSVTICILLSGAWLLMVLLANPAGEFPLNDDWSYSHAVKSLVERHRLELSGFTSMPLITQVFWGALFCLPFGFSFTTLRISTIVIGLLGILVTYRLFDEIATDHRLALLGTAVVAVNPMYFQLSLTFMTDVPFYMFSMSAFLFLFRALRTEGCVDLGIGYTFALLAILTRQLAIVIPLAFLIAYLSKNRASLKSLAIAGLPAAMFAGLLVIYPTLLKKTIGLPALYNRSFEPITESAVDGLLQIPRIFADRLLVQLVYLGLLTLPFLIIFKVNPSQTDPVRKNQFSTFIWAALFVTITGFMLWQGRVMPLVGNVLFDFGLGPPLLRDTYLLGLQHLPVAPKGFWIVATVAAIAGGILILRYAWEMAAQTVRLSDRARRAERSLIIFPLSAGLLYSASIGAAGFLDRYLIWLLPLLPLCLVLASGDSFRLTPAFLPRVVALAFLSVSLIFAVAGTHDYLAWNRARWQALAELTKQENVSFRNVDGGFEFNGWYAYDASYLPQASKSWWWVQDDLYVISFGPVPSYEEIRRYPFRRWIPPGEGNILVLQRVGTPMSDRGTAR